MAEQTCSIDGCKGPLKARGWCDLHYRRWQRNGDPEQLERQPQSTCEASGCDEKARSKGYCDLHYRRWLRNGDPEKTIYPKPRQACSVEGCDEEVLARGWCSLHYQRWRSDGDPGEAEPRYGGSDATYNAVHFRLSRERGKASDQVCIKCGKRARDWAYQYNDPNESVEIVGQFSLVYSSDLSYYEPMCRPCHTVLDRSVRQARVGTPPFITVEYAELSPNE